MSAANPRISVVLEKSVHKSLCCWAKRDGVSLSLKVRDLVKEALEMEEDRALAGLAIDRDQTFDRNKTMIHSQTWAQRKRSKRA